MYKYSQRFIGNIFNGAYIAAAVVFASLHHQLVVVMKCVIHQLCEYHGCVYIIPVMLYMLCVCVCVCMMYVHMCVVCVYSYTCCVAL